MIEAKIVADSINPQGDRITTYLLTFPRFILAELNTHRVFSKNSASSRAIPFKKMVEMVKTDPFIPIAWQKPHKGMQGAEYYDHTLKEEVGGLDYTNLPRRWLRARDSAVSMAEIMADEKMNMPVTKQICNRLLEPFMWHTVLLTGTEFENFFELRCPQYHLENVPTINEDLSLNAKTITLVGKSKKELLKQINEIDNDSYTGFKNIINKYSDLEWMQVNKGQAEIHMGALAEAMYDAYNESTPKQLKAGEWHIPFGDNFDKDKVAELYYEVINNDRPNSHISSIEETKIKISTARCARLSYMTFDGEIDYEKDIKLHDQLLESGHFSPFEHCARAMSEEEYDSFIKGKVGLGLDTSSGGWGGPPNTTYHPNKNTQGWCNNYRGFIQYRYLIENKK